MVAIGGALVAGMSSATTVGTVTPNLYGNGVSNGGYTIATDGALEIGLRASLRYDINGQAQPIYNYNSATDAYEFNPASSTAPANRSVFNFDWSIDTDTADSANAPAKTISDYTYVLGFDTDPGVGATYSTFDPYAAPVGDETFGYNSTAAASGFKATDAASFTALKTTYNVSQQSWNMGFGFLGSQTAPGLYNIYLSAYDNGTLAATSAIRVWVGTGAAPLAAVPLPAGLPLMASGIGGLALLRLRRKRAA